MLKEVIAIIRPGKCTVTAEKLADVGVVALTRHRIYGRGKQKGLRYGSSTPGQEPIGISFLPKWMFHLMVEASKVDSVVKVLMETNRTGEIGDGKIFVCPIMKSSGIRAHG